jgi:predicted nucleic acid-binding protein
VSGPPRIFVDANILIRGLTLPRFPYEVLRAGTLGQVQLLTSASTLARARHYIETRFPAHMDRFERFSAMDVLTVVDDPPEEVVQQYDTLVRDADDVPVALAAMQAGAMYLVSTDPDLTVMDASTQQLRQRITPMRPGDFLKEVLGWTSAELSRIEMRTWETLAAEGGEQERS